MRNVDHTVDVLRDMIGQPGLAFSDEGHFELVFDGSVRVDVVKISETEIELSTHIDDLDDLLTEGRLEALLTANYHGHGTGAGRIALDPRNKQVIYCERFDVELLEAHQLEQRILTFLKFTLYWQGPGTDSVMAVRTEEPGVPETIESGIEEMNFIRI